MFETDDLKLSIEFHTVEEHGSNNRREIVCKMLWDIVDHNVGGD